MAYNRIKIEPLTGTIGAEISGADLRNLDAETVAEIQSAFLENVVIFFREQPLDIEDLKTFTSHFGDFGIEPYVQTMTEHPEVIAVVKEADEVNSINFGGHWHSDWSFQEAPPMATILHGQDIPLRR